MKKALIIVGLFLLLFVLYSLPYESNSRETRSKSIYKLVDILQGELVQKISDTGAVEPNFQVEVKSKASGEVLNFPYEEGNFVKKGDLLLQLDKSDEIRAVSKAEADEQSSIASLKKVENALILQKNR